jgi:hypothetical protein
VADVLGGRDCDGGGRRMGRRLGLGERQQVARDARAVVAGIEIVARAGDRGQPRLRRFGDGANSGARRIGMAAAAALQVEMAPARRIAVE